MAVPARHLAMHGGRQRIGKHYIHERHYANKNTHRHRDARSDHVYSPCHHRSHNMHSHSGQTTDDRSQT